jgi:thioesterase domain-containing protein
VVPLQPGGDHQPFFCVHDLFGDVLCYARLARHLGLHRPFYALQPPGLNGAEAPLADIRTLAAYHVDRMRAVQPRGPYALGGLCSGGVVAFEMACQLHAQGQTVSLLALFDGAPPGFGARAVRRGPRFLASLLRDLPSWLIGASELTASQWSHLLRIKSHRAVAGLGGGSRRSSRASPGDISRRMLNEMADPSAFTEHHRRVAEAVVQGLASYRPGIYPGRVTLFRSRMQPLLGAHAPDNGWGRLAGAGVEVQPVPGNHLAMLREPHVRVLARRLRGCLHRAEASGPTAGDAHPVVGRA